MRPTLFLTLALSMATAVYADTVNYTYDDAGRLTSVTYSSGAVITYTYDPAGNLTSRTVTSPASTSAKHKPPKEKAAKKTAEPKQ